MRPQSRLTGYLLILFVICSASALVAQQYCLSGTVTETVGISSFRVGDPIALTMTLQPGSQSCQSLPEGLGTTCSAHAALQMQSGTRHWSSIGIPLEESAQIGAVSYTAPDKSITNISLDSDNALEASVHFALSGFPGNLLAGGTLPAGFPSPAAIASSGATFTFFVMQGSGPATISYTGQNCAGGCTPIPAGDQVSVIPEVSQNENWCWAASGEMLMEAVRPGCPVTQCGEASVVFKKQCCAQDSPPSCFATAWPIFEPFEVHADAINRALSFEEIEEEITCKRRPFLFTWLYFGDPLNKTSSGAHMMVGVGYDLDDGEHVSYIDPDMRYFGLHRISYTQFVSGTLQNSQPYHTSRSYLHAEKLRQCSK